MFDILKENKMEKCLKKHFVVILIICVVFSFLYVQNCMAAEEKLLLQGSGVQRVANLSGKASSGFQYVTLRVLKPGVTEIPANISVQEFFNYELYMDQKVSDVNGAYLFQIPFQDVEDNKVYKFLITYEDNKKASLEVDTLSQSKIDEYMNLLLKTGNSEEMQTIIRQFPIQTGVESKQYSKLSETEKSMALQNVSAVRPSGGFLDIATLNFVIEQQSAIVRFNLANSSTTASLIGETNSIFNFTTTDIYKKYGMELDKVSALMALQHESKSSKDLTDAFDRSILLNQIYGSKNWYLTKEIINSYLQLLRLDATKLAGLSDVSLIYKALNANYYTADSIVTAYDNAVTAAKGSSTVDVIAKGGTSGGGGSGGSIGIPILVPNVALEREQIFGDSQFADVALDAPWAVLAINDLYNRKIINGRKDGTFDPSGNIVREEFVKILVIAAGISVTEHENTFSDVPDDSWFAPYVEVAKNHGLVEGYSDNIFGAGQYVTRQDMAVMVYRLVDYLQIFGTEKIEKVQFSDEDKIALYARQAVKALSTAGVVKGNDGYFKPEDTATRAQAAQMVYQTLSLGGENE